MNHKGGVFHYDNAKPKTSSQSRKLLQLSWEQRRKGNTYLIHGLHPM